MSPKSSRDRDTSLITQFNEEHSKSGLTKETIALFQRIIYDSYKKHRRDFAWRNTCNPYHIFVSEIMLQQTQTSRVEEKYPQFLQKFPDFSSLAQASLKEVLTVWQGLGYNRRARSLKKSAEIIASKFNGKLPSTAEELKNLPGIGPYTAAAIQAFAFNKPVVLIETNIRTVYIFFFFHDEKNIPDEQIHQLVEKTLDVTNPRKWYNALMDYGFLLKKQYSNPSRRSAHYSKQSPFEGSTRQLRGMILRKLIETPVISEAELTDSLGKSINELRPILQQMNKEGMLKHEENMVSIR